MKFGERFINDKSEIRAEKREYYYALNAIINNEKKRQKNNNNASAFFEGRKHYSVVYYYLDLISTCVFCVKRVRFVINHNK